MALYRRVVSAEFTRPADTTAYAAGDAVSNSTTAPTALSFSSVVPSTAKAGRVIGSRVLKDGATATNATFTLYLFSSSPTATNDNTALALVWANRASFIGKTPQMTMVSDGSVGSSTPSNDISIPFTPTATTIYGLLQVNGAYTPANGENFRVEIMTEFDIT